LRRPALNNDNVMDTVFTMPVNAGNGPVIRMPSHPGMTQILVTSASGANGDGYGTLLGFSADGLLTGPFSDDRRIADPRGLGLSPAGDLVYVTSGDDRVVALDRTGTVVLDSGRTDGLDPGGGTFAPDGRYCVTLRRRGTILALPAHLDTEGERLLPDAAVPFPRGFGFGSGGELYLSSGIGPAGQGDNTIAVFDRSGRRRTARLVNDPELSPLDLTIAPNGNVVVSSEWPFGSPGAKATVREYDPSTGRLIRVLAPGPGIEFAKPRGLRFGPGGRLYCVGRDHVVAFDFPAGQFLGVVAELPRLNGQAVLLLP
jgi:DNA-binding beta-propeller fold protein YncE